MIRIIFAGAVLALTAAAGPAIAGEKLPTTLYRNPNCDCCLEYAKYLRGGGFDVTVDSKQDLASVRKQLRIPEELEGCHVMVIDRYAVEGHVPLDSLNKLLTERPNIIGISLPGMPAGTPGMTGRKTAPFTIYQIEAGGKPPHVYATE